MCEVIQPRMKESDMRPSDCLGPYSGSRILFNLQPVNLRFIERGEKYITVINTRRDKSIYDHF